MGFTRFSGHFHLASKLSLARFSGHFHLDSKLPFKLRWADVNQRCCQVACIAT